MKIMVPTDMVREQPKINSMNLRIITTMSATTENNHSKEYSFGFKNMIPIIKNTLCAVFIAGFCINSSAGVVGDVLRSINDDYTWSIEDTMGPGVKVADYHYRWGATVSRLDPYPLTVVEHKKEQPWGSKYSILSGQLSDKLFHVEWITMDGIKYNINIPIRKLVEKNNLSYKKRLDIKAYLKAEDEYVIEAKDSSNPEYIEIYNSKNIKDDPEDLKKLLNTINPRWFNMNIEVPPGFDCSLLKMSTNLDNSYFSNEKYRQLRIKNEFGKAIRSGQTLIPSIDSLFDTYKISWVSFFKKEEVAYTVPLKNLISSKSLDTVLVYPNIYNYSHEVLVKILPDDNLEIVLTPKEEFKQFTSAEVLIYSSKN